MPYWRPIKQYFEDPNRPSWVLVRIMDGIDILVPMVATYRDGHWYSQLDTKVCYPVVEYFDMSVIDEYPGY